MKNIEEKKYSQNSKTGNKGVDYLGYIMGDYCIFHKIDGSKDVGFDVMCEWVFNEIPSGNHFFIQVKTYKQITDSREIKIKKIGESRLNLLDEAMITNIKRIDEKTINYWKKYDCPVFLFVVVENEESTFCLYKRFTPLLHLDKDQNKVNFYLAGQGKFLGYANNMREGGFARDLFIDSIRCNCKKGSLSYYNPRILGLNQFPENINTVFGDLAKEYKKNIESNINKLQSLGYKIIDERGKDYTNENTYTASTSSTSSSTSSTTTIIPSTPPEKDKEK